MAGIGKTQLAKEYARTYSKKYDLIWLMDANQDFLPQLRELGQKLNYLKACPMPGNSQISQERWLEALKKCYQIHFLKPLFIIDDIKNNDQVTPIKQTFKNLPILLTSQNQSIRGHPMQLKCFTRKESLEYLNKSLPGNSEKSLNELEGTKLLEDYRHTVSSTFTLFLEQVKNSPHALELLKLTSFLGSQKIPKHLLKSWMIDHKKLSDFDFYDATSVLIKYFLDAFLIVPEMICKIMKTSKRHRAYWGF